MILSTSTAATGCTPGRSSAASAAAGARSTGPSARHSRRFAGHRQIPDGAELRRGVCFRAAEHRRQHHGGYRRRGHDLQHPDRRRNACAADHVCNGLCQYACHLTENKEESSMRSSVDAAAFYKAMTALMDIPAKVPSKSCVRSRRSLPGIMYALRNGLWIHGCP